MALSTEELDNALASAREAGRDLERVAVVALLRNTIADINEQFAAHPFLRDPTNVARLEQTEKILEAISEGEHVKR